MGVSGKCRWFQPELERLDERTMPTTWPLMGWPAADSSLQGLLTGVANCTTGPALAGRCGPELSEPFLTLLYVYSQAAVDLVLGPVWGQPVRDIYRAFLEGPVDHREYGDGHEVIEGNDRAVGFRDSSTTRRVAGELLNALHLALVSRFASPPPKGIDCGSLPADEEFYLPIRRTDSEGLLTPAELRPLELGLEYDEILEIPGIMAGGVSDSLGAGMDDRALDGILVVTRRTSGGQTVALDLRTQLTVSVRDSIDFCPGALGGPLAQFLTRPLQLLQANSWAVAVPFTATFTAHPESLTLAGDDLPASCRPRAYQDDGHAGGGPLFALAGLGQPAPLWVALSPTPAHDTPVVSLPFPNPDARPAPRAVLVNVADTPRGRATPQTSSWDAPPDPTTWVWSPPAPHSKLLWD